MTGISTLDEIIRRSDIVEIAKTLGVQLGSRQADHTLAVCPFHSDTRPSLALYRDTANPHYHCFACGAHGGVIDFVEQKQQSSRDEAVRWLAREVGMDLPRRRTGGRDFNSEAGHQAFEAWLSQHHDGSLLQRFAEQRHIDPRALRQGGGHAVNMNRLVVGDLSPGQSEAWEQAGVLVRRKGELAPIVRGEQVVFPVDGGFIFRTIDDEAYGDKGRRYRFSKGLRKSDVLFGSSQAAERLGAEGTNHGLFIVEGLMDVLRMHSLGFAAVGILGTSLSSRQADQITSICTPDDTSVVPVHLFLDADNAGRRATAAALKGLLTTKNPVPVDVIWPDQEGDPDELLRGEGLNDAVDQLARWTHPVLAALVASYTGFAVESALDDLLVAAPLKRVETLRYILSLLRGRWEDIRDLADPAAVYLPGADDQEGTWLRDSIDRAAGLRPRAATRQPAAYKTSDLLVDEPDVQLRRALRIAQSSNFRREYPFDWGGMTRLALAAKASTMMARELLKDPRRRPMPYSARLVPKDDGRTRLKAGPWPEDSLLQQYVLSELLRARRDAPDWYTGFPAVRRIRTTSGYPIMTGPDALRPVGPPDEPAPVVAFAYQIDQEILEGEAPPAREGMFVPYRECWQQFIDHFDNFVARQPLDAGTFYAVRLDISGFFDNLPRYAVDNVLQRALADAAERCFAGRDFSAEVAELLAPDVGVGEENNRARGEFIADWLSDQSFGFRYFDPSNGQVRHAANATIGVPQGPDLSAFLANMALFPLDHAATTRIEDERNERVTELEPKPRPAAAYGRYVDDMVIVSTSEALLSDIETLIGEALRRLGLAMNAKHERTQALSRRRIREWLLGEKGAAVAVSAGGEETPSTDQTRVDDLLIVTAETPRSRVLQLLFHPDLFAERWAVDPQGRTQVEATLQRMRGLPSIKLRYNDWVSAARWALHSFVLRNANATVQAVAEGFWEEWSKLYGRDIAEESFGESERDYANRQAQLTLTPLTLALEGLERSIDSRHDRRSGLDADLRKAVGRSRERLARLVYEQNFCDILLMIAKRDPVLEAVTPRIDTMLRIQSLAIRGLAATVCAAAGVAQHSLALQSTVHYAVRRFALNALDRDIASHAAPLVLEVGGRDDIAGSPEAEPLLGLHEAIARLLAGGPPDKDPLDPLAPITQRSLTYFGAFESAAQRGLGAAFYITSLTNKFLSLPENVGGGPDVVEALRAFIEIVVGSPESNQRLQERQHLLSDLAGPSYRPIAVPPGVDVQAFFAADASQLKAFSVIDHSSAPAPEAVMFGVAAKAAEGDAQLAAFECEIPATHRLFSPFDRKVKPDNVSVEDVQAFVRAYRDLATSRAVALDDDTLDADKAANAVYWPVTPFHLFEPKDAQQKWRSFGSVARLPVESQAFVRLTRERLHSVAVHANGRHLWQIGFALADALGYRGFARSSELDRLSVAALEPVDGLDSIPFYMMQLTVPRLCGAFIGRSRSTILPGQGLPAAIEHQLKRLEDLSVVKDNVVHLTRLLELGAETKAAELLRDAPAPLQVAGALSAVFGAVGRAASRAELIFAQHLPKAAPQPLTHRRIVDLWLCAASRLEGLGPERTTTGLKTAAAAMRVLAISRLLQALTLEIWSLLSDEDRRQLEGFAPDPSDLDLPQEVLLVSRSQQQRSPTAEDQVVRLISVLTQHAVPGATARNALDQITPLGWVVALATVAGLLDIEPVPDRGNEAQLRPELLAVRKEVVNDGRISRSEQNLRTSLTELAGFLAQGVEDETVDAVHDATWPWRDFKPLVDGAAKMVDVARGAAQMVEQLYGLVAETRSSRLFQVSEADDKGYCLVVREAEGRQNLAGWQIDRDSLGVTRPGDIECRNGADGTLEFVWSETRMGQRMVGMSLGYRSLADFAGQSANALTSSMLAVVSNELDSPQRDLADSNDAKPAAHPREALTVPAGNAAANSGSEQGEAEVTAGLEEGSPSIGAPPLGDALLRLKQHWHEVRRPRPSAQTRAALRIALLQMNVQDIGHSFYHPVCEVTGRPFHKWEESLEKLRSDGVKPSKKLSLFEARRRAILREALERCVTLDVELLVLPEYAMRADTVAWLADELESLGANTSILAGTFRHPARAAPLAYYSGVKDREVGLGAIVPLIVPGRALSGGDTRSRGARIYSRLKKYPSTGLSEVIRPENRRLKAVYDMHDTDGELPERLRYVRDLICSEVFVAMAPANIYSAVPPLLELHERFGSSASINAKHLQEEMFKDLAQIGQDTSPAIGRSLTKPRQTIMAVPAATTRPFDHHIFGEAGAKAAGLTTVFTNMAGPGRGQSCFIGCYRSSGVEGSSVWSMQSPYHGRAPGIWTYRFSGGAPLGKEETALVVAEVNPIDTVMSKPARQVEAQPITLVAHIPFFIGTGETNDTKHDLANDLAKRILDLGSKVPPALSSCSLTIDQVDELRSIANDLAKLDKSAEESLRLRSEGLQVASMQPHAHPQMPLLIDWAYVAAPLNPVEIEMPLLDAVSLNRLDEG